MRHGSAKNEAARFYSGHLVDAHARIRLYEFVDRASKRARMSKQGRDVAEDHPGFGIIRNRADHRFEIHFHPFLKTRAATASSFANSAGSRLPAAVMNAVSSTCSMPSGEGVRVGPSFGATRAISRRAFSAF